MKFNPISLLTILLLLSLQVFSQDVSRYELRLKSGSIVPQQNLFEDSSSAINQRLPSTSGRSFVILQFEKLPSLNDRELLSKSGIELLEYIPNYAFTALIRGPLNVQSLVKTGGRAIVFPTAEQKMQPLLAAGKIPASAIRFANTVDVWMSFPSVISAMEVQRELEARNFEIVSTELMPYRIFVVRLQPEKLHELAGCSFVEYVQAAPKDPQPINNKSIVNSRANLLKSNILGGRNLTGRGVVVGVGDNANPLQHVDFNNRVINRNALPGGAHGIHVMGTVAGAGNIEEKWAGYAPKATIIKQNEAAIIANAGVYVQDYGMVLTNNSYGIVEDDCATFGVYDLWSRVVDLQAVQLPQLQQVFATGNSGLMNCAPYSSNFGTVLGSFQSAKNTISVGATTELGVVADFSSRGPVRDGRIKPEIMAQGALVVSTWPTNNYSFNNGTSMAAPGVTGGLGLLYERYRQLHGNANPKNGLMKALLINGATDRGNAGPDYTYGFGWMNLLRSVKMMENANYFNDSIAQATTNTHNITVPANTAQLKVMLYWNDPAASPMSAQALVHDLDLEVRDASNTLTLPKILNPLPANVNNVATTGADHLNNIEQVVIDNPTAGNYTISIIGTAIAQNPRQEYFLVYDTIPVSATLTYPIGGERLKKLDSLYISWDAFGNPGNTFTLQYSTDNSTWTDIATNLSANLRQYKWFLPDTTTDQARVRIIQNGSGLQSTSGTFVIIGVPTISMAAAANQCDGHISINWTSVPGATDYEVMMLRGEEMVSMGTSTGNNFVIRGLSRDTTYWVSVRARINGNPGERARAISRTPNNGNCSGTISDFDLRMDAILSPVSGRVLTSSELTNNTVIRARIKNLDNSVVPAFNIKYSVNGGAFVTESATNIAAQALYTHTFAATYDFSAPGDYLLTVVVQNTSNTDPVTANDTMRVLIRQLENSPITLISGVEFIDDFEVVKDSAYRRGQVGIVDRDRYDFYSSTTFGRLRTFVNSGMAYSGQRALTLDSERYNAGGTADSLIGTFNLLPHFNTTEDIRLDFQFKHHGQETDNPANRVWIRGDDTSPWIQVYDLFANQEEKGVYKQSASIELSDILSANGQDFSTSFQVRFGQYGNFITADDESGAGYTFDDIRLYIVENDIQMLSIDTPTVASCGLNNSVPVRVSVRNSADFTINNIPVHYIADGGTQVNEIIASIPANTTISYSFSTPADFSITGSHTIIAWVDLAGDSFSDNDTTSIELINSPLISSFPYLQSFEGGAQGWYARGQNNSWQLGTPAAAKINKAANGVNAWKTNLTGSHNGNEFSFLYSPCFDVTGMSNPQLSFSLALDLEDCGDADPQDDDNELCDGAYVEYSTDGVNWVRLGQKGEGTNWYNKAFSNNHLWSVQDYTRWHVATISLPQGHNNLRIRFVLKSDPFVNLEGIAIDDIHIYDSVYSIYDGPPYISNIVSQAGVSGTGWVDFTDNGGLVVSVNPNGQNLGNTDSRTYINTGAIRTSSLQYYHDRNITVQPANVNLVDSATVRFYFLDSETENLINATGCVGCSKPASAYDLGVSKYSDADDSREDGTISNNVLGNWLFIPPSNVQIVPFAKGYYAEFRVKDFSEFWLNNGGITSDQTLPAELISFVAEKISNRNVATKWQTAWEENVMKYEVEVAAGNQQYQQGSFRKIGEVNSGGNTSTATNYSFIDTEPNKSGVRYYRLRILDIDGRFSYSPVRPVTFDDEIKWQVFPNPGDGKFNLVMQDNPGVKVRIRVYDLNGKLVQEKDVFASGFVEKINIDLQSTEYASGLYLLDVTTNSRKESFRIMKM